MNAEDRTNLILPGSEAFLCADGRCCDYIAVTAIDADGAQHFVLAEQSAIGNTDVLFDPTCADVQHEQLGPLPLDTVRRITIASRIHRCGRPTKAGTACRTPVARPGQGCVWHGSTSTRKAAR